ncbi:hypothetical protein B0T26DRAFT_746917 [Lasiosphaeria miniovina]|uniref:Uncharacterized protein n=1 Tax=Lasiosphaeria miniovina TaxID=1954250 RepID=A0AA40ECM3_9PEZI|nr:uncharacterized protein B0T26DRAFT_746917 [Lasiosphaeria miniovina]KAK0735095.1 hypothetical protein B0T26DRAFT_746917 [Lasiosphaeria miniovina]
MESRWTDLLLPRASATMPSRPTSPEWAELPRRPDKERDCSRWLVWRLCRAAVVVVALVLVLHTRPPLPAGLMHGADPSAVVANFSASLASHADQDPIALPLACLPICGGRCRTDCAPASDPSQHGSLHR